MSDPGANRGTDNGDVPENGANPERLTLSRRLARFLNQQELSPEERRSVLEDLFVFGKHNQVPFLVRMSVLLVLSTIIATAGLIHVVTAQDAMSSAPRKIASQRAHSCSGRNTCQVNA